MTLKFENSIIDLLLCPPAQDDFKSWKLELLLIHYSKQFYLDQIEDVVQILYKCITELEKHGRLKGKFLCLMLSLLLTKYIFIILHPAELALPLSL